VLQCNAVCCSVVHCVAVYCSALPCARYIMRIFGGCFSIYIGLLDIYVTYVDVYVNLTSTSNMNFVFVLQQFVNIQQLYRHI